MGGEEGLKSTQKEAKRAPRHTEEQPRAPEVKPREPPRPPKRKPREPSRAPRQFLSKRPEITDVKLVLPPRRRHDFRCQGRSDRRTCPEGERLTPYVRRSLRLGVRSDMSPNAREHSSNITKRASSSNPEWGVLNIPGATFWTT